MIGAERMGYSFVDTVPERPEPGVLYVSIRYTIAIHLCACGCGFQTVTPLSPDGWRLTFDGQTVTLYPSIGNGRLPCGSHYWIRRSRVVPAAPYNPEPVVHATGAAPVPALPDGTTRPRHPARHLTRAIGHWWSSKRRW